MARDLTTAQAAEALGIDGSTLRRWVSAGCPHTPGRRGSGGSALFDLAEVRDWIERAGRDPGATGRPLGVATGTAASSPASTADLRQALLAVRVRKETTLWQRAALELERAKGALVAVAAVEEGRVARVLAAKAVLMGGPASLAPVLRGLDEPAIMLVLEDWVRSCLAELSREPTAEAP